MATRSASSPCWHSCAEADHRNSSPTIGPLKSFALAERRSSGRTWRCPATPECLLEAHLHDARVDVLTCQKVRVDQIAPGPAVVLLTPGRHVRFDRRQPGPLRTSTRSSRSRRPSPRNLPRSTAASTCSTGKAHARQPGPPLAAGPPWFLLCHSSSRLGFPVSTIQTDFLIPVLPCKPVADVVGLQGKKHLLTECSGTARSTNPPELPARWAAGSRSNHRQSRSLRQRCHSHSPALPARRRRPSGS